MVYMWRRGESERNFVERVARLEAAEKRANAGKPVAPEAPAPNRVLGDAKPPRGGMVLARWARQTYCDTLIEPYGKSKGWPDRLCFWTDAEAAEAYEAVVRGSALEKRAFDLGLI